MPLLAESEFALVKQYMKLAIDKSPNVAGAPSGDHDLYSVLVDAAVQERDEAALRQYAPLAEAAATRIDHKLYLAIAHRAWGVAHRLANEYAQAERRLKLALSAFAELGARWQSGVTLFELGELARVQAQQAAARDYFSRALAAFEQMRAAPDIARTRAALDQALPTPLLAPTALAGLTEREVEVLRWLARGLSNQAIADQLVLSRRTVHAHLRSIYSKLNVTTRSAATRAAIELKLG